MCGTSNLTGPKAHNIIYPYNIPIIYINTEILAGLAVAVIMDGSRSFLLEIQVVLRFFISYKHKWSLPTE